MFGPPIYGEAHTVASATAVSDPSVPPPKNALSENAPLVRHNKRQFPKCTVSGAFSDSAFFGGGPEGSETAVAEATV